MKTSQLLSILTAAAATAVAQYATPPSTNGTMGPDKDGKYEISAQGIRGHFIPYGASISNLFVKDKNGIERDIVLGFDNASFYSVDPFHPHLGGVPGKSPLDAGPHPSTSMWADCEQVAMQTVSRIVPSTSMVFSITLRLTRTG
jgi:hypothetical protein